MGISTITSDRFIANSVAALKDTNLQTALDRARDGFINKRLKAISQLDNYEELRERGATIKKHSLQYLGHYLEEFEIQAQAQGAQVHWAKDGDELNQIVLKLAQQHKAKLITKGKSMVAEETGLSSYLAKAGINALETDLGEYIVQLAEDKPSHIVAPAIHKTRGEIAQLFKQHHQLGERSLTDPTEIVAEARQVLRDKYLAANVGITGANFLIADRGAMMLITNEGNGDMSASLPKVHIATVGIEKVVPTLDDAWLLMRLLTSNASGQRVTCYTSLLAGAGSGDNPVERHFVLLDNGRSEIYNSKYQSILSCIRCGACMNHCPVYGVIGGQAYGSVYPGPLGAVLTPLLVGEEEGETGVDTGKADDLPHASSLCGRCVEVCPVKIPLTELLRQLRDDAKMKFKLWRLITRTFSFLSRHPVLYGLVAPFFNQLLRLALLIRVRKY